MTRKFSKKKGIIAGIILVAILLIIIRYTAATDRAELTQVEIILRDLMAPLYSGVMQVSSAIANIGNSITSYNELLEENRLLKEQVRDLSMRNNILEEYRLESQRLAEYLNLQETYEDNFNFVAARVIRRDLGNWFETITIDRGTNHGIRADMAVINHQGLVGRVVHTTRTTSEVRLLLDRESAVGAVVRGSRDVGIVEATTSGDYQLQITRLHTGASVEVGDVIVTSILGTFPRGLPIGYVAKVELAPTGLVQQAMIIPRVEFNRLEEVMVITGVIMDLPDGDLPSDEELGEGENE